MRTQVIRPAPFSNFAVSMFNYVELRHLLTTLKNGKQIAHFEFGPSNIIGQQTLTITYAAEQFRKDVNEQLQPFTRDAGNV